MSMWNDPAQMELASKMLERQANALPKDSPERAKLMTSVAFLDQFAEDQKLRDTIDSEMESPLDPGEEWPMEGNA